MTPGRAELTEVWRVEEGLEKPESAVFDAARNVIYVSSIGNEISGKDGSGYISRISPDGSVLERAWVTDLNAPKGLALRDPLLYVAVVDELVAIDVESGEIVERHPAEGAEFLNDVAVDASGNVYVSDSATHAIYRLSNGQMTRYLEGGSMMGPNGVYAADDGLIVAAGDSTQENPGNSRYLKRINYETRTIEPLGDTTPLGAIDAVEPDGHGGFFLSDWVGGTISRWTPGEGLVVLEELEQGTADFTYVPEQGMIYLPLMMSGQLLAYRLEWH